jgi:hypothetical protein
MKRILIFGHMQEIKKVKEREEVGIMSARARIDPVF